MAEKTADDLLADARKAHGDWLTAHPGSDAEWQAARLLAMAWSRLDGLLTAGEPLPEAWRPKTATGEGGSDE